MKECIIRTGAYGIAIRDDQILLVEQAAGPYSGKLDLPGGKIECHETPEQALLREFLEETGYIFSNSQLFDNFTATIELPKAFFHQIGLIYKVENLILQQQNHELKFGWFHIKSLNHQYLTPFALRSCTKT